MPAFPNGERESSVQSSSYNVASGSSETVDEKVIGRNRSLCKGVCLAGPGQSMILVATLMIAIPCLWFLQTHSVEASVPLAFFCYLLQFLSFTCFLSTAYKDPGIVPKAKNPLETRDPFLGQQRRFKLPKYQDVVIHGHWFRLKYCNSCHFYRSPRTVHCYVCNNCVEFFDHHCPWVGNCVGRRNYRQFYLFLVSTSLLVITVLAASIVKVVETAHLRSDASKPDHGSALTTYMLQNWDAVALTVYTTVVIWFVCALTAYHSFLIGTNRSTYEQIKRVYDERINPWNQGVLSNFVSVLCRRNRPSLFDTRDLSWRPELSNYVDPAHKLQLRTSPSQPPKGHCDHGVSLPSSHIPREPPTLDQSSHPELNNALRQTSISHFGIDICTIPEDHPDEI